jgi:Mg/Co/Ni transporter MgtE
MKKVKDIMAKDIISVKRSTTLSELFSLFKGFHSFPLVLVVDGENRLIGQVWFKNVMEVFNPAPVNLLLAAPFLDEQKEDIFELDLDPGLGNLVIVQDIIDKSYLSVDKEDNIDKAYYKMKENKSDLLPVVDKNNILSGVIGIFDIVRTLFQDRGIT